MPELGLEPGASSQYLNRNWSPCHLPPRSVIEEATEAERLWAVQQTLKAFGFSSVADVLVTQFRVDAGAVRHRTTRFFQGSECGELLVALLGHPKFDIQAIASNELFCAFAKKLIANLCNHEIHRLTHSPKLQRRLYDFSPSHFENFEIFREIRKVQEQEAPILSSVIQHLARVDIGRKEGSGEDPPPVIPDIMDGRSQEKVSKALRNRRLISIVAVQMIAYGHSKQCNLMQGIVGYYLYAANTPKRTIETLHQFGLSCAYDSILRGLRATAKDAMKVLAERTQQERFFVSYDNLNFYKHVRDQRMHNRAHQVNYTAGYVLFMGKDSHLPAASIDYTLALDADNSILLPNEELERYNIDAARYNTGKTLYRYCRNAMDSQRDDQKKPVFSIGEPPLCGIRASQSRADYMTFPTMDHDEASIDGSIAVLKDLTKILDLRPSDIEGRCIMLNGDYLTVRNVMRAIYRRQEHREPIYNFSYYEPVAGLFHLQMNTLKMLMHVFEGRRSDPGSLLRFASLLRRKSVGKEVKDFHGCNEFFNHVFDGHLLALVMKEVGADSLMDLKKWLGGNDWAAKLQSIAETYGRTYTVEFEKCRIFDSIQETLDKRISMAMEEREATRRARAIERQQTGRNAGSFAPIDWKREEARIRKELVAGTWDTVWQNAQLFMIAGLVYRDFSDACRNGYSGRVEKCIENFVVMFQGSKFRNYAGECLHLVLCLKKMWKPEFRQLWLDHCLIRPTPKQDYWCGTDRHGETIIRGNKDKIRPSANAQGDEFLRDVIGPNIPSLEAVKEMVYKASGASSYGSQHHEVDSFADVSQVCSLLTQEDVYSFKRGRGTVGGMGLVVDEAIDLFAEGIARLSTGAPLRQYKSKCRANWGLNVGEDEDLENVDALESELLGPGVLDDS